MIRFDNVAKSFRKTRVLDAIDLEIGVAERVALIGSNGAGKTTLIRCLLGEYAFDGRVTINGDQVVYEPDGSWTVVISGRDPRHPNWVDTQGHSSGRIWLRWFLPESTPAPLECRVVPVADVERFAADAEVGRTPGRSGLTGEPGVS